MAAPVIAAGTVAGTSSGGTAATSSTAAAGSVAGRSSTTARLAVRTGLSLGRRDDSDLLGWLLGAIALLTMLVLMLPVLVMAVIAPGAGGSPVEQIGPGSPIPPGFIPTFNQAGAALNVNPYLLASVADQESGFGTGPGWTTPNTADCVGFMQICIGGKGGNTWGETVSLTSNPHVTTQVKNSYRLGQRPGSYPLETTHHPDYNDPYDAVMAAAVVLRGKVGGRPIPNLDNTAYQAACGYYGACANSVANYAQAVLSRARLWESESALSTGAPGLLNAPPGSRIAQLVSLATQIGSMRLPYCWGGGHGPTPGPSQGQWCQTTNGGRVSGDHEAGLDCSGSVRWLLVSVGVHDDGGIASGAIGQWLAPGPGHDVTVYYNAVHTYLTVDGHPWGTSDANYRGGPDWIPHPEPTAGYAVAHPPGL